MTEKKTRTPVVHPFVVDVAVGGSEPTRMLVGAYTLPSAVKHAREQLVGITVREASPREVHALGVAGVPYIDATGDLVVVDPEPEAAAAADLPGAAYGAPVATPLANPEV